MIAVAAAGLGLQLGLRPGSWTPASAPPAPRPATAMTVAGLAVGGGGDRPLLDRHPDQPRLGDDGL